MEVSFAWIWLDYDKSSSSTAHALRTSIYSFLLFDFIVLYANILSQKLHNSTTFWVILLYPSVMICAPLVSDVNNCEALLLLETTATLRLERPSLLCG